MVIPVTLITLAALVVASWLIPGGHACPMTASVAGHSLSVSPTARCQPVPATWPDRDYLR